MNTNDLDEIFITLLAENQRKIYSYILSAVSRRNVADDIMQQTLLLLWRNFSRYEAGTNFAAWAKEIAKYEIFNYRKKKAKDCILDYDALEKVMEASVELVKTSDMRIDALEGCLKKLSEKNRSLINYRYYEGFSCRKISKEFNCPVSTIYKTFARMHTSLHECVRRTMDIWEAQS